MDYLSVAAIIFDSLDFHDLIVKNKFSSDDVIKIIRDGLIVANS